jgi:hypothetical protein
MVSKTAVREQDFIDKASALSYNIYVASVNRRFRHCTIRGNVYEKAHRNRETGLQTVLQPPVSPFFYAHCLHPLLRFCEAPRFASPAPASPDASRDGGQEAGGQARRWGGQTCTYGDAGTGAIFVIGPVLTMYDWRWTIDDRRLAMYDGQLTMDDEQN